MGRKWTYPINPGVSWDSTLNPCYPGWMLPHYPVHHPGAAGLSQQTLYDELMEKDDPLMETEWAFRGGKKSMILLRAKARKHGRRKPDV